MSEADANRHPATIFLSDAGHAALDGILKGACAIAVQTPPLRWRRAARRGLRRWRLLTMLVLAGAAHAAIIGLVRFNTGDTAPPRVTISVVRLMQESDSPPEQASHLATANQRSGRGQTSDSPAVTRPAPEIGPVTPITATTATPALDEMPSSTAGITRQTHPAAATAPTVSTAESGNQDSPGDSAGIAARKAARAAYLTAWRRAIEQAGTRRFPDSAAARAAKRSLLISVTLRADGNITAARVVESSGSKSLDQAALDILRNAAPFPAFPHALRQQEQTLTFAYRWNFMAPEKP